MSARGHRPSRRPATGMEVGTIAQFKWAGVGEWTQNASRDPADIVTFDESLSTYLSRGFAGMSVAQVAALRRERELSR